jgi:3D (Asp-Asp-Asp) domain-containing protein
MSFGLVGTVGFAAYITACKPARPMTAVARGKEISVSEIKREEYITTSFSEDENSINVIVSYYSNTVADCGKTDGIGANNLKLSRGHIAMPKEYEFGTKLYLEGMGVFENQDTGGAIKRINSNTIKVDMYIPNASEKYLKKLGINKVRGKIVK